MNIAVLGIGRMGSWLASALRSFGVVAVYDRNTERMSLVPGTKKLRMPSELAEFRPDLLINAVGIGETVAAYRGVEPFLQPTCILTDIATIKSRVFEYYAACPLPHASLHPLFGPNFGDLNHAAGRVVFLLRESDESAKDLFRRFFASLKCRVLECTLEEHDMAMGMSLTLPVVSSMAFAAGLSPETVPSSSLTTFRDLVRKLFQEDDRLLAEILLNPHSLARLENMTRCLEFLKHVIRAADYEEALRLIDALREKIRAASGPALDNEIFL